jgi:oligoendopeptidase F
LQDRDAINDLWTRFLDVRLQLARNAGKPDYRAYRWQELLRLDYTPEDTRRFESAIEEIVVPAVARRLERRRRMLGLDSLRPWDLQVDPMGRSPLRPFGDVAELRRKTSTVFHQVDPGLGDYFDVMDREGYLDLDNRMNKAPGGYCTDFPLVQRPFIFMNAVGMHADVQTLVHESGHAFHNFESVHLPYTQQRSVGLEFAEVASMSMELLAAPYLSPPSDGFYGEEDAARARVQHLERMLTLWLTVGSVDAFQHWVYEHPDEAADPDHSDAVWMEIRQRFFPVVDYSGLERELETSWHGILHIHVVPFYIVEYGVAQLGAVQVWANARRDQAAAIAQYRHALSLGGTRSLPQLFAAAGARLAFDAESLREAVQHIEETLEALE